MKRIISRHVYLPFFKLKPPITRQESKSENEIETYIGKIPFPTVPLKAPN